MKFKSIVAAAAAPLALGAILLGTAGQASAATKPPSTVTCGVTDPAGGGQVIGSVIGNLVVPAGTYCYIQWGEVTGNVSVQGVLSSTASTFDRNVSVSGPGSELLLNNYPSHIKGNLSVDSSSGGWNGSAGTSFFTNAAQQFAPDVPAVSQVDGNMSFTNNTGWLYIGAQLHVGGNFTAYGNGPYDSPGKFDHSGLTASGAINIS
jgi:hypothetical protein